MAARIRTGPNFVEIIVGAVLSLLLGVLLATGYLILKPVPVVSALPKEKDKDAPAFYFMPGRKGLAGGGWMLKREAFLRGQTITLGEDEINSWIESLYPVAGKGGKEMTSDSAMVQPGTPNVRFEGNGAILGSVLVLDLFGWKPEVVAQSHGNFAMRGGTAKFVPDTVYVGSFPMHRIPVLSSFAFGRVTGMWKFPEDLSASWGKVSGTHIEKQQLVLEQSGT